MSSSCGMRLLDGSACNGSKRELGLTAREGKYRSYCRCIETNERYSALGERGSVELKTTFSGLNLTVRLLFPPPIELSSYWSKMRIRIKI
jgi:hypothetical protein